MIICTQCGGDWHYWRDDNGEWRCPECGNPLTPEQQLDAEAHKSSIANAQPLSEWVAWNRVNFDKRSALIRTEGRLLRLLDDLAGKQADNAARTTAANLRAEESGEPDDFNEPLRLLDEGADLQLVEIGLVDRLALNQDEQARLLGELVEEVSEEEIARHEREADARVPRRKHMRMVHSRDAEGRAESARAELDAKIDRLLGESDDDEKK